MNIYVGNLSWSMSDDDLSNLFTQFGSVTSAKILKDKVSGRSKGFGFVEMETDEEANNAIARPAGEGGGGGFKKRSGGFGGGNRGGGSRGGYGGGGNRGGYGGGRESRDY